MQKVITISPRVSGVPALIIMPGLSEFLSGGCERHNLYPRAVPASSPAAIIVTVIPHLIFDFLGLDDSRLF
ncbi:hypothetical protein [Salmonella enterica]|uniref:hypothetical protein n=1 Tax=Salmonella enterica TaxID=28901 RepID=UPI0012B6A564|nr:hypothetical protein [Salmonella enterica]